MAGTTDTKALSHGAYAYKRETRVSGRWLEIGNARFEIDAASVPENLKHLAPHLPALLRALRATVLLDRTPLGGFTGKVILFPLGMQPPQPDPEPQRPDSSDDNEDV
jgi:hypothetical protein